MQINSKRQTRTLLILAACLIGSTAFLNGNPTYHHHASSTSSSVSSLSIRNHYPRRIRELRLGVSIQKSGQVKDKEPVPSASVEKQSVPANKKQSKVKGKRSHPQSQQQQRQKSQVIKKTGQKQQQQPRKKQKPWSASFHVSKKTQEKIQQAAQYASGTRRTPLERATSVLQTLLNMPPERCNPANLVCALTLSAKTMGQPSHASDIYNNAPQQKTRSAEQFRSLLFQVLDILHELVIHQKALNSRQLCNVIWAVAKHYDRDPLLLPLSPQMAAISSDQFGLAETWDLNDGDEDLSPAERVDATVQDIARQLTSILTKEADQLAEMEKLSKEDQVETNSHPDDIQKPRVQRETKLGEICMASWAYGVLRPRRRPPGWLAPPQMGKLPQFGNKAVETTKRNNNFITFEQWTTSDNADDLSFINPVPVVVEPQDAADALFDAIGEALCRPLEVNSFNNPSMYDPPFALMRVADCSWSEIANVAWAFEKRARCQSKESEMLLRSLSREASRRLLGDSRDTLYMLSRDISQLIWALGALQQDNFRLAHDLVGLVDDFSKHLGFDSDSKNPRPFREWSCPDIVQMILSMAHARIDESALLHGLFEEAHFRLVDNGISTGSRYQSGRKTFLAWEVSVMLWAQARLFLTASEGDVFGKFPGTATKCIQSTIANGRLSDIGIGPQEQANIAWALTVLEEHQSDEAVALLRGVFRDAADACEDDGLIQLEHAHQLWQALFLLEEESPSAASKVPTWFRDYLSEKWDLEKSRKKISSARHKAISQVLNLMNVAHYNEHDEDIDVAIVLKPQASWAHQADDVDSHSAMKVAVEFDGPNHFTRLKVYNDGRPTAKVRALGHTVLKYRLLKKTGWTVVRVPYYEFDKIPFWAGMERQRYLQRLLKTHANIKFSEVDISEYSPTPSNRKTRFD